MLSYVRVMWNLRTWCFLPIEFPILLCKLLLINAIRIGKFLLKWSVCISWMLSRQKSQHSFVGKIPKAYRGLTTCSAVKGPEVGFSQRCQVRCTGVTWGQWQQPPLLATSGTNLLLAFTLHGGFYQRRKLTPWTGQNAVKDRALQGGKEEVLNEAGMVMVRSGIWWWGHESRKGQKWGGCL